MAEKIAKKTNKNYALEGIKLMDDEKDLNLM